MTDKLYKIGEVANKLGTSIRTIRYYEEEALITPIRTNKGTRLYDESHIQRLKAIFQLTHSGFSINTIKKMSDIRKAAKTGQESSHHLSMLFDETISKLEQEIQQLNAIKSEVISAQQVIKTCHDCPNKPNTKGCPDCQVIKNLDEILLLNLIWDSGI